MPRINEKVLIFFNIIVEFVDGALGVYLSVVAQPHDKYASIDPYMISIGLIEIVAALSYVGVLLFYKSPSIRNIAMMAQVVFSIAGLALMMYWYNMYLLGEWGIFEDDPLSTRVALLDVYVVSWIARSLSYMLYFERNM